MHSVCFNACRSYTPVLKALVENEQTKVKTELMKLGWIVLTKKEAENETVDYHLDISPGGSLTVYNENAVCLGDCDNVFDFHERWWC